GEAAEVGRVAHREAGPAEKALDHRRIPGASGVLSSGIAQELRTRLRANAVRHRACGRDWSYTGPIASIRVKIMRVRLLSCALVLATTACMDDITAPPDQT